MLLILCCISLITVIGGAVYEHVAVVPKWSAAPPLSLSMVQGDYGLNAAPFWQSIHPITLLLFIAALASNWKTERRKLILWPFAAYIFILACTAIYFVPELLSIIGTPYSNTVDADLKSRADLWEGLSIGRLVLIIIMAAVLLSALTRPSIHYTEKK